MPVPLVLVFHPPKFHGVVLVRVEVIGSGVVAPLFLLKLTLYPVTLSEELARVIAAGKVPELSSPILTVLLEPDPPFGWQVTVYFVAVVVQVPLSVIVVPPLLPLVLLFVNDQDQSTVLADPSALLSTANHCSHLLFLVIKQPVPDAPLYDAEALICQSLVLLPGIQYIHAIE